MQDEDEASRWAPCVQISGIFRITVSEDRVGAPPIHSAVLSGRCHIAQQSLASFPVSDCRSRHVLRQSSHGLCDVRSGADRQVQQALNQMRVGVGLLVQIIFIRLGQLQRCAQRHRLAL